MHWRSHTGCAFGEGSHPMLMCARYWQVEEDMDLLRWYKSRHEGLQGRSTPLEAWDRQFYVAMARVRCHTVSHSILVSSAQSELHRQCSGGR